MNSSITVERHQTNALEKNTAKAATAAVHLSSTNALSSA